MGDATNGSTQLDEVAPSATVDRDVSQRRNSRWIPLTDLAT
jgi:hypothetical protein